MYENSSPIKHRIPCQLMTDGENCKINSDESIPQSKSDMTSINNLQLSLDPAFAYQLEELFGPVVERECNDFLLPCQRIVQIDMKTAELIHKLWKNSTENDENPPDSNGTINKDSKKKRKPKQSILSKVTPSLSEHSVNEPLTLTEIMDMEYALELHKKEKLKKDIDFSTKLKRQELYNLYPGADPTALDEIFESNNYSIANSIKALGEELGEQKMVIQESVMVNYKKPVAPAQKQENIFNDFVNSDWKKWVQYTNSDSSKEGIIPSAPTISSEALELRQLATDHFNQRQYFIQKAKDAFHRGMSEVASFYSQRGSEHQQKFKEINKMASKLISEQRNDSLSARVLDLHGLYVQEAIPLLDKFIRNWKQAMQSPQQAIPQSISVITGQGLHSERGAKLRPSVMEFLKKTGLGFSEVHLGVIDIFLNPG
ncbi:NEDD4-binding protein 2 [Parasteatoda tepidariorum]|uniref:NEDD4-binding protein 2 n=1 Tax=Parasteatoda tepidariorum TaxID=114398 RepID=UPI0039BCE589